jgi:hypothetical protein
MNDSEFNDLKKRQDLLRRWKGETVDPTPEEVKA